MIKNLQVKFIVITMTITIVITAIIFGITMLANYKIVNRQLDGIVNLIVENDGKIPAYNNKNDMFYTRESQYSTRFFTVVVDESGDMIDNNMKHIVSITDTEVEEIVAKVIKKHQRSGVYSNFKYRIVDKNGNRLIVFLDATIELRNFKNTLVEAFEIICVVWIIILVIITGISRRVLKPLLSNMERQKQFITNAGHELKTPLSVINADIDVLEMTVGEENEWINSIKNQTNRLEVLIKSLLSLANMEEKKKQLSITNFSLSQVISECINDFKALKKNKKIEFDDSNDVKISADENLIKQLIMILLDNSIKYTPEWGKIQITLEHHGKTTKLEVANDCDNVENINTSRLFERFYRADESRNKKKEGYGIGLSIAKSIVDAHKGKINAFITKEKKICFRVVL